MLFTKLRLSGFKSFVEPTELLISPGLTGIVGPNGCGKSNLVEALKWAMGETSAKQMRGGEMDNVIFGGTADRPARNVAEVNVHMDNTDRTAPSAFNDHDDIEVSRRIERERGSTYRVNGREVRARDVQILFADQATGARSTALVSQGRIGALISAKPEARRALLEEAAGITGLHSRRHEAELRLRAAETNLERLDDVLTTLEAQLQGLKKQARQARRYRNVSEQIRQTEAVVLHHNWTAVSARVEEAERVLAEAEAVVTGLTRETATATTAREDAATALVPLREDEAGIAAELQRLSLARAELDSEERRINEQREQCRLRIQQIADDLAREDQLARDAAAALERLGEERDGIERRREGETGQKAKAEETLAAAADATAALETRLTRLTERIAAGEARRAALEEEAAALEERRVRLERQIEDARGERQDLEGGDEGGNGLEELEEALEQAHSALAAVRRELDLAERTRIAAEEHAAEAREARHRAEESRAGLRAEHAALTAILAEDDGDWSPLSDTLAVENGYETALGVAIGDDLAAPSDQTAPRHWRVLPELAAPPALPEGAVPLSRHVRGETALGRRLAQIGVVPDPSTGERLWKDLAVGQRLVTRDGDLFRWDGFTVRAGAPSSAATRLQQRGRLDDLAAHLEEAEAEYQAADQRYAAARREADDAGTRERDARRRHQRADETVNEARPAYVELNRRATARTSRLEALRAAVAQMQGDRDDTARRLATAQTTLAALEDLSALRTKSTGARDRLEEARAAQRAAQSAYDRQAREADDRRRRLEAISAESGSWRERREGAEARIVELRQREAAVKAELAQLAARPGEIDQQRRTLLDSLSDAETRRDAAADKVAAAETRLAEMEKALKAVEARLAEVREGRVRAESQVAMAEQSRGGIRERIAERLECAPDAVLSAAGVNTEKPLLELEVAERRLERYLRERESIGPVNLRAEQEAEELEEQIATMQSEREDLIAAIGRLRHGIGTLNREARQRLLASFGEVNRHFQELFVRLFGGGRAHLELIDSDDPLDAGLEVFASPPGKRLQALSLLSGGEQALTAIALMFGVFLTNPAPICVLDEVDAPLDDANVDRFCTLLEELAHTSETRFLLVTHHRMTMARMDRLYGVTMPERGVSQMVSVDLGVAEALRQTA
ncbi:MAG: chromosome segregation protein SMC [Alphaproteobacteria bacterium]